MIPATGIHLTPQIRAALIGKPARLPNDLPPRRQACGFLGCKNVVVEPEYPWQMCPTCFGEAMEVDDSEFCDLCDSAFCSDDCRP